MSTTFNPSERLRLTLEEMKRKLEEERQAAETLTRNLSRRSEERPYRTHVGADTRLNLLEVELAGARKQIADQKDATERWIQQLTAEREAGRTRLATAQASVEKLEAELKSAQEQIRREREAAEGLIQQLVLQANAGSLTSPVDSVPARVHQEWQSRQQELETEIRLAHQQLADQKHAAEQLIQHLTSERDTLRTQMSALHARIAALEEELRTFQRESDERQRARDERLQRLEEYKRVDDETIRELTQKREEERARYREMESRMQSLGEGLAGAQAQFREEREAALRLISQLEAERDASQAGIRRLEEESVARQNELEAMRAQIDALQNARAGILHAATEMQQRGETLLGLVQQWGLPLSHPVEETRREQPSGSPSASQQDPSPDEPQAQ